MIERVLRPFRHWAGRRRLPPNLAAGDVCSIRSGEGRTFGIAKVLARRDGVVHVRVYKERFGWRLQRVDTATLSLGSIFEGDFGIGHLPLSEGEFGFWRPEVICRELLSDEELSGYEGWRESGGGVWR